MKQMDTIDTSRLPDHKPKAFEVPVVEACTCIRYIPGGGATANVLLVAQVGAHVVTYC